MVTVQNARIASKVISHSLKELVSQFDDERAPLPRVLTRESQYREPRHLQRKIFVTDAPDYVQVDH